MCGGLERCGGGWFVRGGGILRKVGANGRRWKFETRRMGERGSIDIRNATARGRVTSYDSVALHNGSPASCYGLFVKPAFHQWRDICPVHCPKTIFTNGPHHLALARHKVIFEHASIAKLARPDARPQNRKILATPQKKLNLRTSLERLCDRRVRQVHINNQFCMNR
jgi:hypothetical protein